MIVPIFLPHLGCQEHCIYCHQGYITDEKDRDIPSIVEKSLGTLEGMCEVGLFGGNVFGIEPSKLSRLFSLFEGYKDRIISFRVSTKPVPLNSETIGILKENRVTVIELGIPVFNDAILAKLNRQHTVEDFYKAFNLLKNEGFHVALQVMVGLPDETVDDIRQTAEQVIRLSPHYIRIYPLVVLKDTPLHRMYESGFFAPIQFEEAVERAVYIYLTALQHDIKVVKMGLTDNEIIKHSVVAGHYHPAFGYMVKSQAFYLAIKANIDAASIKGGVTVRLNSKDIPHLLGYKRSNIERLKEQGIHIAWERVEIGQGSFIIEDGSKAITGGIFDALPTACTVTMIHA